MGAVDLRLREDDQEVVVLVGSPASKDNNGSCPADPRTQTGGLFSAVAYHNSEGKRRRLGGLK